MAKGPGVPFGDCPYQLWLFHLPHHQVPESQKELGSVILHKHWTNRKHNLSQYYKQHQAQIPTDGKGRFIVPHYIQFLLLLLLLAWRELRLETGYNVSV